MDSVVNFIITLKDGSKHEVPATNIEYVKKIFSSKIGNIQIKEEEKPEVVETETKIETETKPETNTKPKKNKKQ